MAILSDYEEEDQNQKPTKASSSSSSSVTKPFTAVLDPSNPLKFLEKALEFAALESNLFKSESVVKDVSSLVGAVKEKFEAEERKKKKAVEGNGKAEVPNAVPVKEQVKKVAKEEEENTEVKDEEKNTEAKDEEKKGPKGFSLALKLETFLYRVCF